MANVTIHPGPLRGTVQVPPCKSMAHRLLICAALADGRSEVRNLLPSDDVYATIDGLRALGAAIGYDGQCAVVDGLPRTPAPDTAREIDCNESGSTLRFLIPIALQCGGRTHFTGRGQLGKRPLTPYYELFSQKGVQYAPTPERLDLTVEGTLPAGTYALRGDVSSQFITGLLFALSMAAGTSDIVLTTALQSAGYVDLTVEAMAQFGVTVQRIRDGYRIVGGQRYAPQVRSVEGDDSQSAFFLCADMLGSDVAVAGLNPDSQQADRVITELLMRMGGQVCETAQGRRMRCAVRRAATIDAGGCPDIIPVLCAVAAVCPGTTRIVNAGRLRIKECDRLHATACELNALGARITEHDDALTIEGVERLSGGAQAWSHRDHRIAMMLAIAATACEKPVLLTDVECVNKSYPQFFRDFVQLGGKVHGRYVGQ